MASDAAPPESDVEATFLRNFIKLTEWPEEQVSAGDTLVVGVIGAPELALSVERLAARGSCGHAIRVRRVRCKRTAAACNVLYVGEPAPWLALDELAGRAVLTISDQPEFLQEGGMVRLYRSGERVLFEINRDAVARSTLKLSGQLLSLAQAETEDAR